jgi:hypothetical protein
MSIAEVKERIAKMNVRQRQALQRYLISLELTPPRGSPAWRREMARRIDEMKAGNFHTLDEVRGMLARKGKR